MEDVIHNLSFNRKTARDIIDEFNSPYAEELYKIVEKEALYCLDSPLSEENEDGLKSVLPVFEGEVKKHRKQEARFTRLDNAINKIKNSYCLAKKGLYDFAQAHPKTSKAVKVAAVSALALSLPFAAAFGAVVNDSSPSLEDVVTDKDDQGEVRSTGAYDFQLEDEEDDVYRADVAARWDDWDTATVSIAEDTSSKIDILKLTSEETGEDVKLALELRDTPDFSEDHFYMIAIKRGPYTYANLVITETDVLMTDSEFFDTAYKYDGFQVLPDNYELKGEDENIIELTISKDILGDDIHKLGAFTYEEEFRGVVEDTWWDYEIKMDSVGDVLEWDEDLEADAYDFVVDYHSDFKALYKLSQEHRAHPVEDVQDFIQAYAVNVIKDSRDIPPGDWKEIPEKPTVYYTIKDYTDQKTDEHKEGSWAINYYYIYPYSNWRNFFVHDYDCESVTKWIDAGNGRVYKTMTSIHTTDMIYNYNVTSVDVEYGSHGMLSSSDGLKAYGIFRIAFELPSDIIKPEDTDFLHLSEIEPYPKINKPSLGERAEPPHEQERFKDPNRYLETRTPTGFLSALVHDSPYFSVVDSNGNVTGVVDGEIIHDIDGYVAYYKKLEQIISIGNTDLTFKFQGTQNESFNFTAEYYEDGEKKDEVQANLIAYKDRDIEVQVDLKEDEVKISAELEDGKTRTKTFGMIITEEEYKDKFKEDDEDEIPDFTGLETILALGGGGAAAGVRRKQKSKTTTQ